MVRLGRNYKDDVLLNLKNSILHYCDLVSQQTNQRHKLLIVKFKLPIRLSQTIINAVITSHANTIIFSHIILNK